MKDLQALVIDDEDGVRRFVCEVLREDGWTVSEAATVERAYEQLRERRWALVFCDVMLGKESGYEVLHRFTEEQPQAQVVLMTGHGSAAGALDAVAFGAYDYLLKPFSIDEVVALSQAVRKRLVRAARSDQDGADGVIPPYTSDIALVGSSAAFVGVMKLVGRIAATNLPVLITGESGTGKEVVAKAIHQRSRRAARAFVAVNCGALPAELIESELFGHTKGSFTGADRDRSGLFEEADGGTVFLDEITETTPAFQVKLLRALQEGEIRRVGSNRTTHVDVRVIAATNRDPEAQVHEGHFRQDLLYRLNAVSLHLPPLRERREDIAPLVKHFSKRARLADAPALNFAPEVISLFETYDWPGNIRELENAVERAVALCDQTVRAEDLPERIRNSAATPDSPQAETPVVAEAAIGVGAAAAEEFPKLAEIEGRYVARVLAHTRGNKQAASRILGVDRKTLERMIKRHNIINPKT